MDKISALMGTKKKTRKVSIDPRSGSFLEEHALQSIDQVDDVCHALAPPSTRNLSNSVSVGFIDFMMNPSMKTVNPLLTESGSTDLESKIDSLPEMYRRSNGRIGRLNAQLLEAVESSNVLEVQRLLEIGASPNATCHVDFVSACHIAAFTGDGSLSLLLKHGAEKFRGMPLPGYSLITSINNCDEAKDRIGRTPIHIAAWAGHVRHLGLFLDVPEAIQRKIEHYGVSAEVEEEVRKLSMHLKDFVNTRCELGEMGIVVPKECCDSIDHNCSRVAERLPFFKRGWTPLHTASYSARHHCVRLLLAAGADPCLRDIISRTPLDVVGSAYYDHPGNKQHALHPLGFTEVVAMLLATDCRSLFICQPINLHTPLHTAVELESLDSILLLLQAGARPANLNQNGETPLHVCVKKRLIPHLQAFIQNSHSSTTLIVDVRDKDGRTVLHSSVLTNWLPGVCLALEAGANTISRSNNGETPLHSAADLGYSEILKEILVYAKEANAIDKPNKNGETALFKAVKKGNIECAKMLLKQGASIAKTLPDERNVFHVAAAQGLYDMLKFPSMKTVNPLLTESGSTDLESKIDSLPEMYRRSNGRIGRLNTQLLEAVESSNVLEVQRLLEIGASPNATCHVDFVSACHIAAFTGDGSLSLLLKHGAEKFRTDRIGRTPIHIAAWAGHVRHLGLFLDVPEAIQRKIEHYGVSAEVEEEVRKLSMHLKDFVNTRCELGEMGIVVPKECCDSIDHNCSRVAERLPFFQPGWTPLHTASYSARHHCVRLLLAAGADPCLRDVISRTPLDVVGSAYYDHPGNKQHALHPLGFTEVVAMLLATDCRSLIICKRINLHTPLHTAVELESLDSISLLLQAGARPVNLNQNGETPLHVCVKKRLKPHLQAFIQNSHSSTTLIVDVRDKDGRTVLHSSVLTNWLPGVCLALEAGANTISRSYNGETPLHSAADLGYSEILKEILVYAKEANAIDKPNKNGETALFKAVKKGNIECAKMLLKQGASIAKTLPDERNVFDVAAARGLYDMLKFLLDYNYTVTLDIVNHITTNNVEYGPIHFAVENGNLECVKLLLSRNAYINLKVKNKGPTPIHIAARTNNVEIVKLILKNDNSSIYLQDACGFNALHTACYHASRDVIKLLIRAGANISAHTGDGSILRMTAIQMIMNNLSKPTEFIHEIFDSCINHNDVCPQDPKYEITIDFGILVPNKHIDSGGMNAMEMNVIESLLRTGNTCGQKRLLIHPVVESFLWLKWETLLPFFYTMLVLYGLFVMTLTIFILSVYYYRDNHNSTETNMTSKHEYPYSKDDSDRPEWLDYSAWNKLLYFTTSLILSQEILFMNASRRYFLQLETWVKFSSIALALLLPQAIFRTKEDWPRHFATLALLLSWLQMTFLLSRFPNWGYYVLMFRKVSTKVLKIILTFVFLVIGFSLSFMVEYRSKKPFDNPWAALVKTMVMMTSEFEYNDLVDKRNSTNSNTSLIIIQLLFLIFLILAAIVLMNLMVAVAVNDLNDLEVLGNIMRLEKQVEFLASLETLVNVKFFMKILPKRLKKKMKLFRSLSKIYYLRPCEPSRRGSKDMPAHVRDAIIDKAQSQKKIGVDKLDCETLQDKNYHILKDVDDFDKKPKLECVKGRNGNDCATKQDLHVVKQQIDSITMKLDTVLHCLISLKKN